MRSDNFTAEETATLQHRQAEVFAALNEGRTLPYGVRAKRIRGRDLFTLAIPLTDDPADPRGAVALVQGVAPARCR
jgi:hypothetical protein